MSMPEPLHALLRAAAAPGHRHELAGAKDAVDALRRARLAAPPVPRPASARSSPRSRWVGPLVKAAAVLLAFVGSGWALAASTGGPGPATPTAAVTTALHPGVGGPTPSAISTATPIVSPSAERHVFVLCRALLAHAPQTRDKLLDNPSFVRLIAAAGDRSAVTAFCVGLVGTPPPHKATPSKNPQSSKNPEQTPKAHHNNGHAGNRNDAG